MMDRKTALTHNFSVLVTLGLALIASAMLVLKRRTIPDFAPLTWLIPLALYDVKKREVPHITFVAVPCLLAALAATARGDWTLAAIAMVAVATSERHHLPPRLRRLTFVVALLTCASLLIATPFELSPGAVAVIGFWMAYELGWWAGADALAAMALALLWPDIRLLVALAVAHLVVAVVMRRVPLLILPRPLKPDELQTLGAPGLPAIALGATLFMLWSAI
jgi:hypothetical protein